MTCFGSNVLRQPKARAQMSLPERIGAVIKVYYNLTLKPASLAHISASQARPQPDFARLHYTMSITHPTLLARHAPHMAVRSLSPMPKLQTVATRSTTYSWST